MSHDDSLRGLQLLARLGEDDNPLDGRGRIGRGPRVTPAVYVDAYDEDGDLVMAYAETERAPDVGAKEGGST